MNQVTDFKAKREQLKAEIKYWEDHGNEPVAQHYREVLATYDVLEGMAKNGTKVFSL